MIGDNERGAHGAMPTVFVDAPTQWQAQARTPKVNAFVRSAWAVLFFQLFAAGVAVAVTAWAAFQVWPLIKERDRLTTEISVQTASRDALETETNRLRAEQARLVESQARLEKTLASARQSADYVSRAITQYHNRNYTAAVRIYDEALALDPENPYVLDLKSYSQFRSGEIAGAIETVSAALKLRPDYLYGYSELARYACAAGNPALANSAYQDALKQSSAAEALFRNLMRDDGQFANLCRPLVDFFATASPN